jgi:uncharacterized membrane protein
MMELPRFGVLSGQAEAVNDAGTIAGHARIDANLTHAVRWTSSGQLVDIHPIHAMESWAYDINQAGDIAGRIRLPWGRVGFVWLANGGGRQVGPVTIDYDTYLSAINDKGFTAGREGAPPFFALFRWSQATGVQYLVGNGVIIHPTDLSNRGRGVGQGHRAVTWLGLEMYELQGGVPEGVNDCGTIVGSAGDANGNQRAVRWDKRTCD